MSKTPITYYGGKQKLLSTILSKIPNHTLYCEPFVGGAAVFFGKQQRAYQFLSSLQGEVLRPSKSCAHYVAQSQSPSRC